MHCRVSEILLAGGRGSGKSQALLGFFAYRAEQYGVGARGLIVRRRLTEMHELLNLAHRIYPLLGATFHVSTNTWRFPSGATLRFARLEDMDDARALQGYNAAFLLIDEVQAYPDQTLINQLRAILRSAEGVPVQLVMTANPGGIGHAWLKHRFVSPAPRGYTILRDNEGNERLYIPCNLEHNPTLLAADPGYLSRLKQSGPAHLVRAWAYGDWDAEAGGVFSSWWDPSKQVLPTFPVPQQWPLVLGLDWGIARPSALAVFAFVSEPHPPGITLPRYFSRGSYILCDELYTHAVGDDGSPRYHVGSRQLPEELGALISAKLRPYGRGRIRSAACDPNVFSKQQGPQSVYEQMMKGMTQAGWPVPFVPAVSDRIAGLQLIRSLLNEARKDTPEAPGLWIMDHCTSWLATVPSLPADPKFRDDIDPASDVDHHADSTRYALHAKPRIARTMKVKFG